MQSDKRAERAQVGGRVCFLFATAAAAGWPFGQVEYVGGYIVRTAGLLCGWDIAAQTSCGCHRGSAGEKEQEEAAHREGIWFEGANSRRARGERERLPFYIETMKVEAAVSPEIIRRRANQGP